MVWLLEDTSTLSFCGRAWAVTWVSFTFTPVWSLNIDSTSRMVGTSVDASEVLNVIVVPARGPVAFGVGFFSPPPHAAPTRTSTATSATAALNLDLMHPTSRSRLHSSPNYC